MAELIKQEFQLVVLKLTQASSRSTSSAGREGPIRFEIQVGNETSVAFDVLPRELGVPERFDPSAQRYSEPPFRFDESARDRLTAPLMNLLSPGQPLWLQLGPPSGYLPLLPWERMLSGVTPGPLLRLPYFASFPSVAVDEVDIVLCSSAPEAKRAFEGAELIQRIAQRLVDHVQPPPVTVHLFVDIVGYDVLHDSGIASWAGANGGRVVLYDPRQAPVAPAPRSARVSDSPEGISNPWLLWITEAMSGRTVEIAHFLCHSYLSQDQAALAVAESPITNQDGTLARFIGPNQLSNCLTSIGAWAVGFTPPPSNFSPMGMRLLADRMAHIRPGPVLLEDPASDGGAGLERAYSALLEQMTPPSLAGMTLYSHPRLTGDARTTSVGESGFVDSIVGSAFSDVPVTTEGPAWVTSTRRYLEQSAASLLPEEPRSELQRAAAEGVGDALSLVQRVLGEQVRASSGEEHRPVAAEEMRAHEDEE